jgi:hypothetical protein
MVPVLDFAVAVAAALAPYSATLLITGKKLAFAGSKKCRKGRRSGLGESATAVAVPGLGRRPHTESKGYACGAFG